MPVADLEQRDCGDAYTWLSIEVEVDEMPAVEKQTKQQK